MQAKTVRWTVFSESPSSYAAKALPLPTQRGPAPVTPPGVLMSIKVAIASSDGLNINLHFGQAKSFLIYELQNGSFVQTERRELPATPVVEPVETTSAAGDVSNCNPSGGFACGSGCGGGGGGCCGGGATGPLAPAVELLLDCRSVVAAQIGQGMRRQFERNAISVFDIELPIEEALNKLAAYYLKFGD